MESFEKVLIGLDNTEMDNGLMQMANFLSRLNGTKEIHFLHVIKNTFISKSLLNEFPTLISDALKERKKSLLAQISNLADESLTNKMKFEVLVGTPQKEILKKADIEQIDLLVLGKKSSLAPRETMINSLTKKAECSLLIVPQGFQGAGFNRILVPIDYSKGAHMALKLAAKLQRTDLSNTEILTQNIFTVPTGYHYTGKSFEEFAEIMRQNAVHDYKNFVSDLDLKDANIKSIYTLDKQEDLISVISTTAKQMDADAVVIGAKLRTSSSTFFTPCSAEKLLRQHLSLPVFVIRKKGKTASFFEYLSEI